MTTLCDLPVGASATIQEIVGDDAIAIRLMEMGLTEGEAIALVGAAPLGDPLEFALRGYRLSLRKTEAARVLVDGINGSS